MENIKVSEDGQYYIETEKEWNKWTILFLYSLFRWSVASFQDRFKRKWLELYALSLVEFGIELDPVKTQSMEESG